MSDALMKRLFGVGRFVLYYARPGVFLHPGFHLWTGSRHVRVLPLPRRQL